MCDPLTPADLDLRDFPYMPLDVVRLRDSDLAAIATGDGFRAAVMLWCAAWHQVPAASLPDDDRMLARLAGYGRDLEAWRSVKDDALRGFVECNDGRLYHPTVAEKAVEAAEAKRKQRERTEAARLAKLAKQQRDKASVENVTETHDRDVTFSVTEIVTENVTSSKGREGKGRDNTVSSNDETETRAERASSPEKIRAKVWADEFKTLFWPEWPHKVGKPDAERAWFKARKSGASADTIISGMRAYIRSKPPDRPWLNPATFLNQRRWEDEPARAGPELSLAPHPHELERHQQQLREEAARKFGITA